MSWPTWNSASAPPMGAIPSTLLPNMINSAPAVLPPNAQYTTEQWAQAQQQNWQQQWATWQQQYQQWHQQYGAEYQKLAMQGAINPMPPPALPVENKPPPPLPEQPSNIQKTQNVGYSTAPPPPVSVQNWQNTAAKRPYTGQEQCDVNIKKPNLDQTTNPQWNNNQKQWSKSPSQPPPSNPSKPSNVEELSEAEKKFDKEFAAWEAQFNKWKEQNANHPDKAQYKEYEKKWESWRNSLLERREQMRKKRLALTNAKQQNNKPVVFDSKVPPPPSQNNDALKQDSISNSFLSKPIGGIPFLDVKEDDKETNVQNKEKDEPPKQQKQGPDFEAISKGINNILNDQNLLNILSMVTKNPPPNQHMSHSGESVPDMSAPPPSYVAPPPTFNDHSNQSYDSRSNHEDYYNQREAVTNFDDQTRSSFTTEQEQIFRPRQGNNNFGNVRENVGFNRGKDEGNWGSNFGRFNNNEQQQKGGNRFKNYQNNNSKFGNNGKFGKKMKRNFDKFKRSDNRENYDNNYEDNYENYENEEEDYDKYHSRFQEEENVEVQKITPVSQKNEPIPPLMQTPVPEPKLEEEELFEPAIVIDYNHIIRKKYDINVTIEPLHMFDYRHKAVNRIPYTERPGWLSDSIRFIREFDPMMLRTYDRPPPIERFPIQRKPFIPRYEEPRRRFSREKSIEKREKIQVQDVVSDLKDNLEDLSDDDMDWDEGDKNVEEEDKSEKIMGNLSNPVACKEVVIMEDILAPPGRFNRPPRIVIILRGPPGSGKTYLAKLIKDKEVEQGGSAPRILSLDDYFMVEHEKKVVEDGKTVTVKEMIYEYEAEMEESYRNSFTKSFKKTITDGYFPFIIVDNINDKVKYFGEMWSFAKQNGFQVYICQLDLDPVLCTKRNIHNRSEAEIEECIAGWEPTPAHHPTIDASTFLQSNSITEVEMEVVDEKSKQQDKGDEEELTTEDHVRSKWDTFDCSSNNLARLDGVSKPPRKRTMEEFLQMEGEWQPPVSIKPGQKRVRWADLEEQRQLEKMKKLGFVVGHTDWNKMMDPAKAVNNALTQTKYI